MPVSVQLNVLGGFSLDTEGRKIPVLPRKARALLSFLAVQRRGPTTREFIGELLWSDRASEQVRHSLRQTLAVLRKSFSNTDVVVSREGSLQLGSAVHTDVSRLFALSANSDPARLRMAVESYTGPLLDGFPPVSKDFDDWLVLTRANLETEVINSLAQLADTSTRSGDVQ